MSHWRANDPRDTFHLWPRPGQEIMTCTAICTIYAVEGADPHRLRRLRFSLGDIRKITEQGVHFRNPIKW
ncbi:hypothetical protein ACNKHV_02050 [Shigella flexneri]